jgi:hypothetical protein
MGSSQPASAFFFYDDFESGLDTSTWYLENINGAQWQHTALGGNGCVVSDEPNPYEYSNRNLDILTHSSFGDFTATWDMRFATGGTHRDNRSVYFRSDNSPVPLGYWIAIGVDRPPPYAPYDQIGIRRLNPDFTWEWLTPTLAHTWNLDTWYSFKLQAVGFDFKLRIWEKSDPEPSGWTIEASDTAPGGYSSGRLGFGNYWGSQTYVDNVGVIPEPAPVVLVGLGVAALVGITWKSRKT